jgi:proton-dependent oligopeptide transporter, POT family
MIKTNGITSLYIAAALEKFSFNGISAMLVLYMTQHLFLSDSHAFEIFSAMMALGYVSPLMGGWLADHAFGNRKTLLLGAIFMLIGLYSLIVNKIFIFYLGLGFTVLGSGFIRSNLPVMLGKICTDKYQSKDATFTLLYVAFNVGSLLGAIGCAMLGEIFGWNVSFVIAGTSMLIFLCLIYIDNCSFNQEVPIEVNLKKLLYFNFDFIVIVISTLLALLIALIINHNYVLNILLPLLEIASICLMIYISIMSEPKKLTATITLIIFMIFQTVFFALYNQENMSLILFAERNINHSLLSLIGISQIYFCGYMIDKIPTTFFQAIDPVWNIILGGLLALVWKKLEKKGSFIGAFNKFSIGIVTTSLGFFILAFASRYMGSNSLSPWWLILAYGLFVIGELCIIPVGFSLVSIIAPKKYSAVFMGIWFLSLGFSMWLAGVLSKVFSALNANVINNNQSIETYIHAFKLYGWLGFAILICLIVLSPFLKSIDTRSLS